MKRPGVLPALPAAFRGLDGDVQAVDADARLRGLAVPVAEVEQLDLAAAAGVISHHRVPALAAHLVAHLGARERLAAHRLAHLAPQRDPRQHFGGVEVTSARRGQKGSDDTNCRAQARFATPNLIMAM